MLLPFCDVQSGRSLHPLHRYPGPLARTGYPFSVIACGRLRQTLWPLVTAKPSNAKYHAIQARKIAEVNAFGKQSETVRNGSPQVPGIALKRFLSIFSDRIFDSR